MKSDRIAAANSGALWWLVVTIIVLIGSIIMTACTVGEGTRETDQSLTKEQPEELETPIAGVEQLENGQGSTVEKEEPEGEETPGSATEAPTDPVIVSREIRLTPTGSPIKEPEEVPQIKETVVIGEVPEEILKAAFDDVVELTAADPDEVSLIRAEEVVWPNGAMGCPEPGAVYTQAEVPGYWIVFEVDGQEFDYRANQSGYFFLCEGQLPKGKPAITSGTPEQ